MRELTAHNRASALDKDSYRLAELAITQFDAPERAELLSTRSIYDAAGRRKLEELGSVHIVTLEADVPGAEAELPAGHAIGARTRTVNTYDEGRPADAAARDLVTTVRIVGREGGPDTDVRTIGTACDWRAGRPSKVVRDPGGLAITTATATWAPSWSRRPGPRRCSTTTSTAWRGRRSGGTAGWAARRAPRRPSTGPSGWAAASTIRRSDDTSSPARRPRRRATPTSPGTAIRWDGGIEDQMQCDECYRSGGLRMMIIRM
ncbi:hypothetical protein [Streptosporangium roseum]|uniref:hypothetical protein n=1 Tax=Streptosporangium roseum TaxID=2001 RepID=UPI00332C1D0E